MADDKSLTSFFEDSDYEPGDPLTGFYQGGQSGFNTNAFPYIVAYYYLPPSATDPTEHPTLRNTPIDRGMFYYNTADDIHKWYNGTVWQAIPDTVITLKDTPATYAGDGGKVLAVKSTEDGVEFVTNPAGVTDHGLLNGLLDDDHPQYLNNARGDARYDSLGSAAAVQANLDAHEADFDNPHNVTAAQSGADPAGSAAAVQANLDTHEADQTNPHATSLDNLTDTDLTGLEHQMLYRNNLGTLEPCVGLKYNNGVTRLDLTDTLRILSPAGHKEGVLTDYQDEGLLLAGYDEDDWGGSPPANLRDAVNKPVRIYGDGLVMGSRGNLYVTDPGAYDDARLAIGSKITLPGGEEIWPIVYQPAPTPGFSDSDSNAGPVLVPTIAWVDLGISLVASDDYTVGSATVMTTLTVQNNAGNRNATVTLRGLVNGTPGDERSYSIPAGGTQTIQYLGVLGLAFNTGDTITLEASEALDDGQITLTVTDISVVVEEPSEGGGTAGVTSFNTRTGAVVPQAGDYNATQVGADPAGTSAAHAGQGNHPYLDGNGQIWSNTQQFKQRIEVEDTAGNPITQGRYVGADVIGNRPATTNLQDGDFFFEVPGP